MVLIDIMLIAAARAGIGSANAVRKLTQMMWRKIELVGSGKLNPATPS